MDLEKISQCRSRFVAFLVGNNGIMCQISHFRELLFLHYLFSKQEKMIRNRFNSNMPENWSVELTKKFCNF